MLFVSLLTCVLADVRLAPEQVGLLNPRITYRVPSNYNYQALIAQERDDNDQFLRSNIDNEANKRNPETEPPKDMLPCRQDSRQGLMEFQTGVDVEMPLRWNNPHDSDCEVNIFTNKFSQVTVVSKPFPCGGGYQDERFKFKIPEGFGDCRSAEEGCVLQIYGHSVESRTYAICMDFVISSPKVPTTTSFQNAINYWDSYDTSHVDSQYSGYRGQQLSGIRRQLLAAIKLRSYLGNGGLVPLGDINTAKAAEMDNQVKEAVKKAEKVAIEANKNAQKTLDAQPSKLCFEGDIYNVVNNPKCERQYTTTYVTNVDYQGILDEFIPKFQAAGLKPYQPKIKTIIGCTPHDPDGGMKKNGVPFVIPPDGCQPLQPALPPAPVPNTPAPTTQNPPAQSPVAPSPPPPGPPSPNPPSPNPPTPNPPAPVPAPNTPTYGNATAPPVVKYSGQNPGPSTSPKPAADVASPSSPPTITVSSARPISTGPSSLPAPVTPNNPPASNGENTQQNPTTPIQPAPSAPAPAATNISGNPPTYNVNPVPPAEFSNLPVLSSAKGHSIWLGAYAVVLSCM